MNEQTDENTKKNAQRNRERANELMRAWTHSEKNTQKTMTQGISDVSAVLSITLAF